MNRRLQKHLPWLVLIAVGATACGGGTRVARIDPNTAVDISGDWNDTDSRLTANQMIEESLNRPWARLHMEANGGERPIVLIGVVRNKSAEHINTRTFVNDMRNAFVNSGLARVVTSGDERDQLRAERSDQQTNASADTRARIRNETGASFMLLGEINTIFDREGGREVKYYQIDLNLTDLESAELVWVGTTRIKKFVQRRRVRREDTR